MVVPSLNSPKPPATATATATATIKLLCSYGGRILPRYPDGKLRYHGGHTRVLAVNRSISFSELMAKLGELSGKPVSLLRCQLPTEDLDALVSITSDEDFVNLVEEYHRTPCLQQQQSLKIRAFLSLPPKKLSPSSSPPPSAASASSSSSVGSPASPESPPSFAAVVNRCVYRSSYSKPPPPPPSLKQQPPFCYATRSDGKPPCCGYRNSYSNRFWLVHNGNHWQ